MSKCLWSGLKWWRGVKEIASPFPCCPVIRECCEWKLRQKNKNHTRVPSKSDYSTSNTSMEDFTPGLNSAIDIVELLLDAFMYQFITCYSHIALIKKTRLNRGFWIQVNWKIWQFIVICDLISLISLESQTVPNFVDKTIVLKQAAAIKKMQTHSLKRLPAFPGHQPLINLTKILENHPILFWTFIKMLYPLKILIIVVHLIPVISYWCLLVKIYFCIF